MHTTTTFPRRSGVMALGYCTNCGHFLWAEDLDPDDPDQRTIICSMCETSQDAQG